MNSAGKKREYETCLSGNLVVCKTHGRIIFRGVVDSLEAEIIEAQVLAEDLGKAEFRGFLGEILDYLRNIMAAEVNETPLSPPFLFGLDAEEIHFQIKDTKKYFDLAAPLPSYTQGPLAGRINTIRTKIREAEIVSIKVFGPKTETRAEESGKGKCEREDIILAMNRLSSAAWWLFCKYLSKYKDSFMLCS